MNKRQLRLLAQSNPKALRKYLVGSLERDLAARHLLLHPADVVNASPVQLAALREYIKDGGWKVLCTHHKRMCKLLRVEAQ